MAERSELSNDTFTLVVCRSASVSVQCTTRCLYTPFCNMERIMTDALEDHEGTVSIGGRTITNLHFADDNDGLAGEEEELAN